MEVYMLNFSEIMSQNYDLNRFDLLFDRLGYSGNQAVF